MRIPELHVVTDDRVLAGPGPVGDFAGFVRRARAVLEAGGTRIALHIRGPRTPGRAIHRLAAALAPVAHGCGARLVVNDRADVAAAVSADAGYPLGVHLGQRGLPLGTIRSLLPPGALVGVSTHSEDEARESREADYLFAGTIYATPSHPGRAGAGTGRIREILEGAPGIPVLAIGGITPVRVAAVMRAGAFGVAVLGGIWDAPDPGPAVQEFLTALS